MSERRQFAPMMTGAGLGNTDPPDLWDVVPLADYGGLGDCFFNIQELDLRGLLAGNEQGLYFDTISLQEACPWFNPVTEGVEQGWFMVYDMLTTVKPTRHTIAETFVRPDTGQNACPGFLLPADVATNDWPPDEQRLNPSQVIWGVWRCFANNMQFKLPETFGLGVTVLNSGYFGQGDYAVAPSLYWTRIVCSAAIADVVVAPSTNLLINARAEKISVPMELSQMMRAAQR